MKKLQTLLLMGLLVSFQLAGQSIRLDNVTKEGFKGVQKMGDDGYFIQYIEGESDYEKVMHIYVLDNNLQATSDFILELKESENVEDVAFNGENFMIIYGDSRFKTRTFKILAPNGTEVASNKLTKVHRRLFEKPAAIMPLGKDFIVVNYIKEKKVGYKIERYAQDLTLKYSQSQTPDKKKLYPVDYLIKGDKVYILEFLAPDYSEYFEFHVAAYNVEDGKQVYRNQLKANTGKGNGYGTFLRVGDDGTAYIGGMYFNGNKTKKANSDGFFSSVIAPDGKMTNSYTDWKDVKKDLKEEGTSAFFGGGASKTIVHDLTVNADGSYTLIGENYRRGDADQAGGKKGGLAALNAVAGGGNDEPQERAMTVASFALFDFNADGSFAGLRKQEKPYAVTIVKNTTDTEDQPFVGQAKGLNLANILNNQGYFPYRFVADKDGQKKIIYHMRYEPLATELLYSSPLNGTIADTASVNITGEEFLFAQRQKEAEMALVGKMGIIGKVHNKMASFAEKMNEKFGIEPGHENEFYLRGSHDPLDFRGRQSNSRLILSNNPGKIVIYDFAPEENESKSKGLMFDLLTNVTGSLKIWEIDVP